MQGTRNTEMTALSKSKQVERLKPHLRAILEILGEDADRKGLFRTPERWAKALLEYTQGTTEDPQKHLSVIFELDEDDYPIDSDDMIIVDNIEFMSLLSRAERNCTVGAE